MKETRDTIIEHAFSLFMERGYDSASLADIVKASGLSKGAVYHHFRDKQELHDAAIEHFFLRFFGAGTSAPSPDESLAAVLDDLVAGYERLLLSVATVTPDQNAYYRFLFSILPKVRVTLQEAIAATRARLTQAARNDQNAGLLAMAHKPEDVADQCLAMIEGTGLLATLEGRTDAPDAMRRMLGGYRASLQ
ncbi:TetR/AcrR family transcriptional regulator [Devosia limi]|nr:TetR/AcrR family transcriptional regulator [Devosia limi]